MIEKHYLFGMNECGCTLVSKEDVLTVSFDKNFLKDNRDEWDNYTYFSLDKLQQFAKTWKYLKIDIVGVQEIDSLGLCFLVSIIKFSFKRQADAEILVSSEHIAKALQRSGIAKRVKVTLIPGI